MRNNLHQTFPPTWITKVSKGFNPQPVVSTGRSASRCVSSMVALWTTRTPRSSVSWTLQTGCFERSKMEGWGWIISLKDDSFRGPSRWKMNMFGGEEKAVTNKSMWFRLKFAVVLFLLTSIDFGIGENFILVICTATTCALFVKAGKSPREWRPVVFGQDNNPTLMASWWVVLPWRVEPLLPSSTLSEQLWKPNQKKKRRPWQKPWRLNHRPRKGAWSLEYC